MGAGQPLFIDKRDPAVPYCSPGQGTVAAINRGSRRVLETVVVRLGDSPVADMRFEALGNEQILRLERSAAAERLRQSGLWTALRTRPFSRVPQSDSQPRSIFVTAMDTRPLAADPLVVIRAQPEAFVIGLRIMSLLTPGPVNLCTAAEWDVVLPEIERLQRVEFTGPHPSGLPGTHIHFLEPVGLHRMVWQIGYQDVIAIGRLFGSGIIDYSRVVALGGESVDEPRLVTTRLGASTDDVAGGSIREAQDCRIISGSVLGGRTANGALSFLGRYHDQICVIPEGGDRHLFGWATLFSRRFTAARPVVQKTGQRRKHPFSSSQNGRFSGMLPLRVFEKVTPLDILPSPLFRALLVRDTDRSQALGCLELDEEDLALCSFVCPAKNDYGAVLRLNLGQIERDG